MFHVEHCGKLQLKLPHVTPHPHHNESRTTNFSFSKLRSVPHGTLRTSNRCPAREIAPSKQSECSTWNTTHIFELVLNNFVCLSAICALHSHIRSHYAAFISVIL